MITAMMREQINYGMFSEVGNEAVAVIVRDASQLAMTTSMSKFYQFLTDRMSELESQGHGEVWDTAVREVIIGRLELATGRELSIFF
jgi:hypothetical protein